MQVIAELYPVIEPVHQHAAANLSNYRILVSLFVFHTKFYGSLVITLERGQERVHSLPNKSKTHFALSLDKGQTLAFTDRDLQDMYIFVLLELPIFTCKEDGYREYFVGFLQAVLPLRGKILNIERRDEAAMYKNQELQNLILALGLGVKGEDFKKDALRYHKIIILTDADVDGAHIRTLLLTFFFRYQRALFDEGCIYVGVPPLYKVERGKQAHYCYDEAELKQLQSSFPPNASYNIQRFKGLGEMMPLQLWETTLDPERRLLKQLIVEDAAEANVVFSSLMGARVDVRKQLIQDSANMINVEQLDI